MGVPETAKSNMPKSTGRPSTPVAKKADTGEKTEVAKKSAKPAIPTKEDSFKATKTEPKASNPAEAKQKKDKAWGKSSGEDLEALSDLGEGHIDDVEDTPPVSNKSSSDKQAKNNSKSPADKQAKGETSSPKAQFSDKPKEQAKAELRKEEQAANKAKALEAKLEKQEAALNQELYKDLPEGVGKLITKLGKGQTLEDNISLTKDIQAKMKDQPREQKALALYLMLDRAKEVEEQALKLEKTNPVRVEWTQLQNDLVKQQEQNWRGILEMMAISGDIDLDSDLNFNNIVDFNNQLLRRSLIKNQTIRKRNKEKADNASKWEALARKAQSIKLDSHKLKVLSSMIRGQKIAKDAVAKIQENPDKKDEIIKAAVAKAEKEIPYSTKVNRKDEKLITPAKFRETIEELLKAENNAKNKAEKK